MVSFGDLLASIAALLGIKTATTTSSASASTSAVASLTTLYSTSTVFTTYKTTSLHCQTTIGAICVNPTRLTITTSSAKSTTTWAYATQTIGASTTPAAAAASLVTLYSTSTSWITSHSVSAKCAYTIFNLCINPSNVVVTNSIAVPVTYAYTTQTSAPTTTKAATTTAPTTSSAVPVPTSSSAPSTSSKLSSTTPASSTMDSWAPSSVLLSSSAFLSYSSVTVAAPSSSSSLATMLSSDDLPATLSNYPGEGPSSSSTAFVEAASSSLAYDSSTAYPDTAAQPTSSSATSTSLGLDMPPPSSVVLLMSSAVPSSSDIASSTAAAVGSGSSCTGTVQTETDNAGNTWTIYCSSDSDLPPYTVAISVSASGSYQDCFIACNNDAGNNCAGFTYVGGSQGVGLGSCWLRVAGGNVLSAPGTHVLGVKAAPAAASSTALPTTGFVTLTALTSTAALDSASSSASSSSPAASAQPTCGLRAWGGTADIGYYVDASTLTNYAGCLTLCQTTAGCLSFALDPDSPVCILYGVPAAGNAVADPGAPYIFFESDGSCPAVATTSAVVASSITSSAAVSTATGAYPFCAAGTVPFIYGTYTGTYTPCDSNPYSTCAQDVDGAAYCNSCGSCTGAISCTADSDCTTELGAGYACITGSSCTPTVNGLPNGVAGAPVCLYLLRGGADKGCYGAD